ncbi:MAG: phage late control D family protein [Alphaproteobacteria bacterium]|nr:phage late control D family protein [Alphaproteobacteria bacterium]
MSVALKLVKPLLSLQDPMSVLSGVEVTTRVGELSTFRLEFSMKEASELLEWVSYDGFQPGKAATISMASGASMVEVLQGETTAIEVQQSVSQPGRIVVRGYDMRYRLARGTHSRTFLNSHDASVIEAVLKEAGLSASVPGLMTESVVSITHAMVQQTNQDDWSFVKERARLHGYEVVSVGATVTLRKKPAPPPVLLALDDALIRDAQLSASVMDRVDLVSVRGWDPATQAAIVAEAGSAAPVFGAPPPVTRSLLYPVTEQAEADTLAAAELGRSQEQVISGTLDVDGEGGLNAGRYVKVADMGPLFSGPLYIEEAAHRWSPEAGYSTTLTVSGRMP